MAWSVLIVASVSGFFGMTFGRGQMAPNAPVILASAEWRSAVLQGCKRGQKPGCEMPQQLWQAGLTSQDYETFNALAYGFDLFVPLVILGQESAWAPSKIRGPWGLVGYWLRWPVQIAGWIIAAIFAATLAGLVGRRD